MFDIEKIETTIEESLLGSKNICKLKNAERVVIWGTAQAAEITYKVCKIYNIRPEYVVDSFVHEDGELWNGIPLIGEDVLFEMNNDYLVIISCSEKYKIHVKLQNKNIPYIQFDSGLMFISQYPNDMRQLIDENIDTIYQIYNKLQDEKSKKIYYHAVNYRRNFDYVHIKRLSELIDNNAYFGNDVISEIDADIVIDCGAYNGDTLIDFNKLTNAKCNTYLALEPTSSHIDEINKYVNENNLVNKVYPIEIAVWNKKCELSFMDSSGMGGNINDRGNIIVKADKIDNIVKNFNGNVDFIKMDIEGAEVNALIGAEQTIRTYQPMLAICIYHKISDLWEIPAIIDRYYGGYKFYVRHHSDGIDETVLYAIPE